MYHQDIVIPNEERPDPQHWASLILKDREFKAPEIGNPFAFWGERKTLRTLKL
jgi:hypothetical protein